MAGPVNRFSGIVNDFRALGPPRAIACEYDMPAPRQQARQALEGLASHDHRCSHGQRLEPLEVGRKVPRQLAVAPNYAISCARYDKRDV